MSAPEQCRSARTAAVYYRFRTWTFQELRDGDLATRTPVVAGRSCHWARFAAKEWQARAQSARRSFQRWHEVQQRHARMLADPEYAIMFVFGQVHGPGAIEVAKCESGDSEDGRLSPHAVHASNGQYQGMFQMGSSERAIYGHGSTPYAQAVAAHRYFIASGSDWSPWSCRP